MSTKQTHQVDTAKQFINGLKRHDVSAELKIGFSADSTSDLIIIQKTQIK